MARAARSRILNDVNGNINDHLHNHIHLTNCIHLKNHLHKNCPNLADKALLRDLVALQRSRTLRDPSASPLSLHSPSVVDLLFKRGGRDALVNERRSVGFEHHKQCTRVSGSSPTVADQPISKATVSESRRRGAETGLSNRNAKYGFNECRRVRREESSRMVLGNDVKSWNNDHLQDGKVLADHVVSQPLELRDKSVKKKGGYRQDRPLKALPAQLEDITAESDYAALSCNHDRKQSQIDNIAEEAGTSIHSHGNNVKREKRLGFRSARRNQPSISTRAAEARQEMSVASNSFVQGNDPLKYHVEEEVQEYGDHNVTGDLGKRCGIPWNWSRIHHRGRSFLDMAGRSHSHGLSEPHLKKGAISQGRVSDIPLKSEHSSSSTVSDGEVLPLLLDASGSQGSIVDPAHRLHDYSGELGFFADNLLKQEIDSDLASEGRSHQQHKLQRQHTDRHQNLPQKYMPRTFRDLVGQNLVVQALSNAIIKRKVGLLYVFYGPHGTGKTTCARIFAKALNCHALESTKPCGFCDSCVAHDMGTTRNVREVVSVSKIDLERVIVELLDVMIVSEHKSKYGVFIFDECDTLTSDCWRAILKVIDRAPRHVVFILVCSSLDVLPHIIISKCQKFFFNKLKDAEIIYTLQWIATKEGVEIDKDALKLIASRSDGSLRDAEMTLEQLSLLGQRISLCLVQELVGLISDEKLVDLLDSALSADTINTIKNLRDIMGSGIEPLALMSQLATVITDILAGSFDSMRERPKRKFFEQQALSKEDMEKLRQALKTLSEAEKQLRVSNDKITWLTAALLQLAPDQRYMLPDSSTDTSMDHSPVVMNNSVLRVKPRKCNAEMHISQDGSSGNVYFDDKSKGIGVEENRGLAVSQQMDSAENNTSQMNKVQVPGEFHRGIEEIWLEVLEKISIKSLKEFMYQEGKLISLSYGAVPTVQLLFNSQLTKTEVEKFRSHFLQAFESVLRSPVTVEIRHGSKYDTEAGTTMTNHVDIRRLQIRDASSGGVNKSEIVEVEPSPSEDKSSKCKNSKGDSNRQNTERPIARVRSTPAKSSINSFSDQRELSERSQSLSLVRSKVSLAHVIQHAEACSQHSGWSKHKTDSVAEKLEQENLRLEPRSRRLLCWNPPRITRPKLSCLKTRTRKPQSVLKFVSCGRCPSSRSSR